ncbi:MAG: PglZ domain-containing protein [Acidiferrobacter sp.]
MHPLHEYIAKQLAGHIAKRRVVVWYDAKEEFAAFIVELRGGPKTPGSIIPVTFAGIQAQLAEFNGSFLEMRARVEQYVNSDEPLAFILYIPGHRSNAKESLLLELEKAGFCPPWSLKSLARNVLRQIYTDGVVDELLAPEAVSYEDLARASADRSGAEPPSLLKIVFHGEGRGGILSEWLTNEVRDEEILAKDASRELIKLIHSSCGLELPEDTAPAKARAVTLRYLLANDFRAGLSGPTPACMEGVPQPQTQEQRKGVANLVRGLQDRFPSEYAAAADRVEAELGLAKAALLVESLTSIDTFRFEERAVLARGSALIAERRLDEALQLIERHVSSFWVRHDIPRSLQWNACRQLAELGREAQKVLAAARKLTGGVHAWITAYTDANGWYRLDQMHRRLEWLAGRVEEELDERALGIVRRVYEDACQVMAEGFTSVLEGAGWTVPGALHQTRVFSEVVNGRPKPVAYFLVDAMRYEMGVELAQRLQPPDGAPTAEVQIKAAVAALPSITPVGMAALLPGASASFAVIEQGGKLGSRIEGTFLPDWPSRRKFLAARIPGLVDLTLDELLGLPRSKLTKKVEGAQVVIVRSQELDHAGEGGFTYQARQVMHTVIDNLTRAVRKLAGVGVLEAVVAADHGHLFTSEREESMRIDAPGGETVELHRRCWIGRGGKTPAGCVRVAATALGYDSDLDFVFPRGCGVFKAGGDLAFHHGATSLQEILIPVLSVRSRGGGALAPAAGSLSVTGIPEKITNRIFSVVLQGDLLTEQPVLPLLLADGRQVGRAGMVVDGELDRDTGTVRLVPGKPVTVALLLDDDQVRMLRIVVQDPRTDGELYRSPADIPVQLGT